MWNKSFFKALEEIRLTKDWIFALESFVPNVDAYFVCNQSFPRRGIQITKSIRSRCYDIDSICSSAEHVAKLAEENDWHIIQFRISGRKTHKVGKALDLLHSLQRPLTIVYNGSDNHSVVNLWFKAHPKAQLQMLFKNAFLFEDLRVRFFPEGLKSHVAKTQKLLQDIDLSQERKHNLFLNLGVRSKDKKFQGTNRLKVYNKLTERFGDWAISKDMLPAAEYYSTMAQSRFVWCPPGFTGPGNRLCEALYLGAIPIVLKERSYNFTDVPKVEVESIDEISVDRLEEYWEQHRETTFTCYTMKASFWNQVLIQQKPY